MHTQTARLSAPVPPALFFCRSLGACMYAMLANAPLRWVDGAPDLSPRTFLHVRLSARPTAAHAPPATCWG